MYRKPVWIPLSLSLCVALAAPAAMGGPKEKTAAKAAITEAKAAMKDKRYPDAVRAFKKADDLDPSAQTKLDLARAYNGENKLIEASKELHAIVDQPAAKGDKKIADAAKKMLTDVEPRIPWLQVKVGTTSGKEAKVTIDDTEVDASNEVPVNPGDHRVIAEADGYDPEEKTVTVAESEHKKVKLALAKSTPDAAPKATESDSPSGGFSKAPAVVAFSIGAVGLGVGIAFGVMAQQQTNDIKAVCDPNGVCPASVDDALVTAKNNGNVSTIGFIAGGVGVATGIVLLIASIPGKKKSAEPPPEKKEDKDAFSVSPWIGGNAAGVRGTF